MNDRQSRAVVAVGVGTELMLDLVRLKIGHLADFQHAVLRHSRCPRKLAARLVILRVGKQNADIADNAAHNRLVYIVGKIVFIGLAEISFHCVAQGVESARNDLLHRHGQSVGRGRGRKVRLRAEKCALDFLVLIGNDRARIHFRACPEHGDDGAEGNKFGGIGVFCVLHIPDVVRRFCLCRDDFAAIGNAAAADSENEVDAAFFGNARALLHFGVGRIRHDAAKLNNCFAGIGQNPFNLVIHAVFLDRTAAVGEHNHVAVFFQQAAEILPYTAAPEIDLRFVFKYKVVHCNSSLIFKAFCPAFHFGFGLFHRIARNGKRLVRQHGCTLCKLRNAV